MKKPFLLIAGCWYNPSDGTGDWKGCFETYDEAMNQIETEYRSGEEVYKIKTENTAERWDWYEIIDLREWAE